MAKNDFVPTPRSVTEALLRHEIFCGKIFEPCCGDGAISKVLTESGYDVSSSDLFDYGFGEVGVDMFTGLERHDNIITNPPFSQQQKVKKHLLDITERKLVLLWYAKNIGNELETPSGKWLKNIYIFRKPIEWVGANIGYKFAWYVWDKSHNGKKCEILFIDF